MNNYSIQAESVVKSFENNDQKLTILEDISFDVLKGQIVSIVGPSGSGKTTLLGLCAGLDIPTSGIIRLNGENINNLKEDDKANWRNKHVGFIFQNFQLIPTLTALDNIMVPLELRGDNSAGNKATELLGRVGLADRSKHYPSQLSGGEQQRVAIARAFINEPSILFADEPTGNLDEETSNRIEQLLFELNREKGTTLVIVTHDMELAHKTNRIIQLKAGNIVQDQELEPLNA